jgi:type III secretory pathway lipoprotein EscJ
MNLVKSSFIIVSTLLLSGCAVQLPGEAEKSPCNQINKVIEDKALNTPIEDFDPRALADAINSEVRPYAADDLKDLLQRATDGLTAEPVDVSAIASAGTQIGIRCALLGVSVEFPELLSLIE